MPVLSNRHWIILFSIGPTMVLSKLTKYVLLIQELIGNVFFIIVNNTPEITFVSF